MARKDAEHVDKIVESKFNRRPASTETLRSNCTTGYIFTFDEGAGGQSQYHHILPIQTLADDFMEPTDKIDFFHSCMAATSWDINDGHNLISLPVRDVYYNYEKRSQTPVVQAAGLAATPFRSALRDLAAQMGVFGALPDLPCHEIGHNPDYNHGVINYLQQQVWRPLAREQKACSVDSEDIRGQLEAASDHWRNFLVTRGNERGGTSHCWVHRNDPGYDQFWFVPFSMNPGTPTKVPPPPPWPGRGLKTWLQSLLPR